MATRTTGKAEPQAPDPDDRIKELEERIIALTARLEDLRPSPLTAEEQLISQQKAVDEIVNRHTRMLPKVGDNEWWIHDRRGEKGLQSTRFYSKARDDRSAYRDYSERTGHRYTGTGADPFYCSESEHPAA